MCCTVVVLNDPKLWVGCLQAVSDLLVTAATFASGRGYKYRPPNSPNANWTDVPHGFGHPLVIAGMEPEHFEVSGLRIADSGVGGWVAGNSSGEVPADSLSNLGLLRLLPPEGDDDSGITCRGVAITGGLTAFPPHNLAAGWPSAVGKQSDPTLHVRPAAKQIDGRPRTVLQCTGSSCEATLLEANLAETPSLAGQAVYIAAQLRPMVANTTVQLGLSSGDSPDGGVGLALKQEWQVVERCLPALPWRGQAQMTMWLDGGEPKEAGGTRLEVGAVVVAPVGAPLALMLAV
eukprot:COSAG04_NODE_2394_length_4214_cov_1.506197_3_plen_290_part_00